MKSTEIQHCVELICSKGCRRVREDIETLAQGGVVLETAGLTESDRRIVLEELRNIMSVYGASCPLE
ncbi:MAG: hypothetical protein GY703_24750 [Gammaproteobacteria bacterium]|nr:hypothetical protein [Gammaproteobacteria bacterium]